MLLDQASTTLTPVTSLNVVGEGRRGQDDRERQFLSQCVRVLRQHEEDLRVQEPVSPANPSVSQRHDLVSMSTPHPHARVAAAAVAVSLSLAGGVVGCAATTSSARTPSVAQSDEIEPVNAELPPPKPRRTPERVIFSDESATIDEGGQSDARAFANGFGDGDVAGGAASGGEPTGLVEQLAASYDEDMKALAAMQANRKPPKSGPDAATETRTPEPESPAFSEVRAATSTLPPPPTTEPTTQPTTQPAT